MIFFYFGLNIFAIILPFLFSFHPRIRFSHFFGIFLISNLIASTIFILWDSIFTRMGVWSFNPAYVSGLYLFNLPLEEVLFFICIPFSCVFTYFCIVRYGIYSVPKRADNLFSIVYCALLIILGIYYHNRLYTLITFESTAIFYFYVKFIRQVEWTGHFLLSYVVLLGPFFLCNGLLTGTGLKEPVVLYNPSQMIGFRVFSIPIEDFIYGFELQLLNVYLFEYFRRRVKSK